MSAKRNIIIQLQQSYGARIGATSDNNINLHISIIYWRIQEFSNSRYEDYDSAALTT